MRIVVFAAFYYPYRGGYVESVYEVSKGLVERGFGVTVFACDTHHAAREEFHEGICIVRIPSWNSAWLNNSFPLPKPWALIPPLFHLWREDIDAIITETRFFPTTFIGAVMGFVRRIPVVHVEQGSCHPASHRGVIRIIGSIIDHTFGWFACRSASAVVGVSAAAAAFAKHLGAQDSRTSVIHNPIDVSFWHPLLHPSLPDSRVVIAFVGRLIHAKGVQDLFRALVLLRDSFSFPEFSRIDAIIIGDGPYRAVLERLAAASGLSRTIRFLGEMDRIHIRSELQAATIFANPSHSEGLPVSVLEAAALALPVIATDVGGTREVIPSECGILVPPRDPAAFAEKLLYAIRNPEECRMFGRAARSRIESAFSTSFIVDAYERVLRSVISHG